MRQERHSQQLLVGSQVIGQKCAAQFVSRQRPALIFKQFHGGVEGCLGRGVVTQRLRRQPLAGQAAHLHRQQLQFAGAIEGGAEKRAGLLDSTRAQQCMRPHHIGAEAPVRQTCRQETARGLSGQRQGRAGIAGGERQLGTCQRDRRFADAAALRGEQGRRALE